MATVTGLTAARMLAIEAASVVDAEVDVSGDLIFTTQGGTDINAGSIYPSVASLIPALLDYFHPIGDIKMTVVNTNPGTIIGGTWVAWGSGRVPVGVDTGQTEFDTVEETGGEKTHLLVTGEMPSHGHVQDAHTHTQNAHTHTQNAHTHTVTDPTHSHAQTVNAAIGGAGVRDDYNSDAASSAFSAGNTVGASGTGISNQNTTATNQNTTATNNNTTATNQNTGGGGAHNNLQPYITCYMWKRTA